MPSCFSSVSPSLLKHFRQSGESIARRRSLDPDLIGFVPGVLLVLKPDGLAVIEVPYLADLIDGCEFDIIPSFAGIDCNTLNFVADRHTFKHGRYMVGNHLPIVSADNLLKRLPDYV
jgi:hypothetical protein